MNLLDRLLSPAICAGALFVGACSSATTETTPGAAPREVEITATDNAFSPDKIAASPGETLHIVLYNRGKEPHSLAFEMPGHDQAMGRVVAPGAIGEMTIELPKTAGSFAFYCPVSNHRKLGQRGTLTIRPAGTVETPPER